MRRLLGHLTWASLGVLLASIGASEVKAATLYEISVTIIDNTNSANNASFMVSSTNSTQNSAPVGSQGTQISTSGTYLNTSTAGTGITLSSLGSFITTGSASSSLNISGNLAVTSGDSYTIMISTVFEGYTQPVGLTSTLGQSSSGTYTNTSGTAGQSQSFQSWYNYPNPASPFPPASPNTVGPQTITIPGSPNGPTSGSAPTQTVSFPTGLGNSPFTLSDSVTINVDGTSAGNVQVQFQGSTTIMAAVPEPASVVMMLTGMPMPLMVLGMLRRRKAQRRMDVIAG